MQSKLKLGLLVFLVFLFSVSFSSAFNVDYEVLKNDIYKNESAEFKILVKNDLLITDTYRLSSMDEWSLSTNPLSDYFSGFSVGPGEQKEVLLSLTPRDSLAYTLYRVKVDVSSDNLDKTVGIYLPIELQSPYPDPITEYVPIILVSGNVNKDGLIDPRYQSTLSILFDNRNALDYSNLTVSIASDFLTETVYTTLKPNDKKNMDFKFVIDPLQKPENKSIIVTLYRNDTVVANSPITIPVIISGYSEIDQTDVVKNKWFRYEKALTLTNNGNIENTDSVRLETNGFKALFTKTSPKANKETIDGVTYFVWDVSLVPQGVIDLNLTVNYRPIFYVIITIILASSLYYLIRSPVIVKKQTINVKLYDGGLSEMKILIHLKNRTPNNYSDIVVGERVPKLADYVPSESMGNIMPSKVLRHDKKGTMLKWNIENIDPFEERIIIYKIKARLTILGGFVLPSTVVKFKDDGNSDYIVHSNKLKVTNFGKEEA